MLKKDTHGDETPYYSSSPHQARSCCTFVILAAVGQRCHVRSECLCEPRDGVRQFAAAIQNGASLPEVPSSFVNDALLVAAPKALPSIASALRWWHRFAVDVLNIDASSTLSPLYEDHVIMYTCIFRRSGTRKNYLSGLRFGCRVANVEFDWDTPRLHQAMRGVARRTLLLSKPRRRIPRDLPLSLVRHVRSEGDYEESCSHAFAFTFLFRVENECLPLEVGSPFDSEAHCQSLPFGRHSACWLESNELVVRLKTRKNKIRGATLRRACVCNGAPFSCEICPVLILSGMLAGKERGAAVFSA